MTATAGILRALIGVASIALTTACGAALERSARQELAEEGFEAVTLHPVERIPNAFSFEAQRRGVRCGGEIELREQMGQTTSTITSRCGVEQPSAPSDPDDPGEDPQESSSPSATGR